MKADINNLENIQYSRTTTYFDSDAAFAEAHVMWDSISDAQHQHEHEMMMQAIEEMEEEDLKKKI